MYLIIIHRVFLEEVISPLTSRLTLFFCFGSEEEIVELLNLLSVKMIYFLWDNSDLFFKKKAIVFLFLVG